MTNRADIEAYKKITNVTSNLKLFFNLSLTSFGVWPDQKLLTVWGVYQLILIMRFNH